MTKEQREYAARDAIASLLVYEKLSSSINSFEHHIGNHDGMFQRVLLDPFHALKRLTVPINHPMAFKFAQAMRDAMFKIHPDDKERVTKYLRDVENVSFEEKMNQNSDWILKRVRRMIPEPTILSNDLKEAFAFFDNDTFNDPRKNDQPLIDKEVRRSFVELLKHVDKGCLSDPPGIPLYYEEKKCTKSNLMLYRCIRGTNDLEGGIHQKFSMNFKSWNAGPEFIDNWLTVFR